MPSNTGRNLDRFYIESPQTPYTELNNTDLSTGGTFHGGHVIHKCRDCHESSSNLSYCMRCPSMYCDACWAKQLGHSNPNSDHEKTTLEDGVIICTTLRLDPDKFTMFAEGINRQDPRQTDFLSESRNEWFGVTKNDGRDCYLSEGPAYENLLLMPFSTFRSTVTPGLVSFVGETGSGKSALINFLIKFSKSPLRDHFVTPIVSESGSMDSTSANVKLYADPNTLTTDSPILYVDCEGLGGDENPAALSRGQFPKAVDHENSEIALGSVQFNPLKINWPENLKEGTSSSRKNVVKTLFPKLLYIFSDAIVYVVHNQKTMETVLLDLIHWAHNATEQSYNKPVLPSLVIVFVPKNNQKKYYDAEVARKILFEKLEHVHSGNASLGEELKGYVQYWENGKNSTIASGEDILKRYYASVGVFYFPNEEMGLTMREQTGKLYEEICRAHHESQERRDKAWMKMTATTFPLYYRKAFAHFAANYTVPFDFSDAWIDLQQVSFNLESGIFNLAAKVGKLKNQHGMDVWKKIARFVASCLLLNLARKRSPGSLEVLPKKLRDQCNKAADEYWQLYWPCQYTRKQWGRCGNGPRSHQHHQPCDDSGKLVGGRIISGPHEPSHNSQQLQEEFHRLVVEAKSSLAMGESKNKLESLETVTRMHQSEVNTFYDELGVMDDLISHSTCLMCLDGIPEYSLPCGHVVCRDCAMVSGQYNTNGYVKVERCPLLSHRESFWSEPWIGAIKPKQAGLRILSLDGGGTKGLVEAEILKRIQKHLGSIPLQEFLDLIVGTSAGGIIACGLGPGEFDVDTCAAKFENMSSRAFSSYIPHQLTNIPYIGSAIGKGGNFAVGFGNMGGRYNDTSMETALKETFSDRKLFGGASIFSKISPKIAVTTSTRNGGVVVLGNYNRRPPRHAFYNFRRSPPEKEMELWEVARATSAAPTYFKPFYHKKTGQTYLDGGLWHNNPIRIANAESKAIWPDDKLSHPDILLSIGTGLHKSESLATDGAESYHESVLAETVADASESTWTPSRYKIFNFAFGVLLSQFTSGLNSQRIWHEWLETRTSDPKFDSRYRRLDVEFEEFVGMDDCTENGKNECRNAVQRIDQKDIQSVADQLIASCFFFQFSEEDIEALEEGYQCSGHIVCRLLPDSVKLLGELLEKQYTQSFKPRFLIQETHSKKPKRIPIKADDIDKMKALNGHESFSMDLNIVVSNELAETEIFLVLHEDRQTSKDIFHISGFPRRLQEDYPVEFKLGQVPRLFNDLARLRNKPASQRVETVSSRSSKELIPIPNRHHQRDRGV